MIEDRFTHTEADAGLYERQRAQDDYDPPGVADDEGGGWFACCPHCECRPDDRTGHDDTCREGCNDEEFR